MNIKRAKEEIKDTIQAYLQKDAYGEYVIPSIRQRPVLLIGPPGVGKTQIMEQIARECQIGLVAYTITHHTRQSAIGLPFIEKKEYDGREYAVTEYTMSEIVASIYDKMEQSGLVEGILFIDEINCVSETLAPTMLQFLQGKSFGSHRIPAGWIIVAAGNPPEYNKSVREFDIVTLDRIRMITVEPDLGVWKEYAKQVNIHPAIRSYLDVRGNHFCQIETTVDGKRFATPRGWEDLSELIGVYETLEKTVDREVVAEYLQHPRIAKDFANYLELYHKYQDHYQIERILQGEIPEGTVERLERGAFDERVSVVSLLLSGLEGEFAGVEELEQELMLLTEFLRQVKKRADFSQNACGAYRDMLADQQKEWEKRRENGLLSRRDSRICRQVSAKLEQYLQQIHLEGRTEAEAVWNRVNDLFTEDSDRYEASEAKAGRMLEAAFDFMEAAFANSQELVMFLTELNTGYYSVRFLQQYECERYYQYNKNLLFDRQEQELRQMTK